MIDELVRHTEDIAMLMMDLMVKCYENYRFTSIAVATSAIACARFCSGLDSWSKDLEQLTNFTFKDIECCFNLAYGLYKKYNKSIGNRFARERQKKRRITRNAQQDNRVKDSMPQQAQEIAYTPIKKSRKSQMPTEDGNSSNGVLLSSNEPRKSIVMEKKVSCFIMSETGVNQEEGLLSDNKENKLLKRKSENKSMKCGNRLEIEGFL